jgi:hypothetical protein
MENRLLVIIVLVGAASCTGSMRESKDNAMLQLVSINNSVVRDSVKSYYERNLAQYSKGVVTINMLIRGDTTKFIISSALSSFGIEATPPAFYTELDSIPILIYTGFEKDILADREYVNQIMARTRSYLDEIPPNYNPVVWEVMVVSQEVVGSRILN